MGGGRNPRLVKYDREGKRTTSIRRDPGTKIQETPSAETVVNEYWTCPKCPQLFWTKERKPCERSADLVNSSRCISDIELGENLGPFVESFVTRKQRLVSSIGLAAQMSVSSWHLGGRVPFILQDEFAVGEECSIFLRNVEK